MKRIYSQQIAGLGNIYDFKKEIYGRALRMISKSFPYNYTMNKTYCCDDILEWSSTNGTGEFIMLNCSIGEQEKTVLFFTNNNDALLFRVTWS